MKRRRNLLRLTGELNEVERIQTRRRSLDQTDRFCFGALLKRSDAVTVADGMYNSGSPALAWGCFTVRRDVARE